MVRELYNAFNFIRLQMITIQNEIINYLSFNCRADFVHKKGTVAKAVIEFLDNPTAITVADVKVLYQSNGELLVDIVTTVLAPNKIELAIPDFAEHKALNYSISAVNQDNESLFYGAFTLI